MTILPNNALQPTRKTRAAERRRSPDETVGAEATKGSTPPSTDEHATCERVKHDINGASNWLFHV